MSTVPAYSIRSLTHSFDGKVVLDIPHLDIPSGQILGIIGPNGSGKTTLLSILALLRKPVSGKVLLQGIDVVQGQEHQLRRNVTLVHQKPVLFATTVRNNIAYGLRAAGLPSREIKNRVHAIMEEMKLSALAERQARRLSGGEAQKTVLARALVLETPIILLDEPTNSLDETFRPVLFALLRRINAERGITIVAATHDSNFVLSLASRIVRLKSGEIGMQESVHWQAE